jgi:hypothetical protein
MINGVIPDKFDIEWVSIIWVDAFHDFNLGITKLLDMYLCDLDR